MSLKRNASQGIAAPPGGGGGGGSGGGGTHHVTAGLNDALDCTGDCRTKEHSSLVLSSAYLGNLKLLKHCASVCNNPLHIRDGLGRNALHVASSKGHLQLLLWLVAKKKVKVDVFDLESKWTALHRSAYYGQLGAMTLLMKYGADMNALDYDGWSPLALLNADRHPSLDVAAINVYTWGRNPNNTLGHDRTRKHPEKLDHTLSPGDYITKVVLCKFHSVFLSYKGCVLTCGHGPGGRLGHDSEQSIVTPRMIKSMEGYICTGIAATRDHTVILTKSGAVYTCGLNDAHQLGHGSNPSNAPANYLAPKLVRGLKSKHVIAVGTGRYHTAMCTEAELYTVGKNLGQLGYKKTYETQVAPHAVAGVNLESDVITHMSVSDSATALLTRKHHVFVCTDFIVRHIRFGFLDKTNCCQFEVCASLSDRDYLRKVETEPTKLLVLDSEHKLWVWEPTKRGSIPKLFSGFAKRNVSHFSLGKSLTVVTKEGEVYKGNGSVNKPLNLQRVPNIQNACAVFADFKANNFAYIQNVFRNPFRPSKSQSTLTTDLSFLLEESCLPGSVSDITIEVGGQDFSAHRFILSSQTRDFASQLVPSPSSASLDGTPTFKLRKKCEDPDVFNAFLHYIYGSSIRLLPPPRETAGGSTTSTSTTLELLEGVESTPDTSFVSLDENDLTEEYDKYCVDNQLQDYLLSGNEAMPPIAGHSTPRKISGFERSVTNHSSQCHDLPEKVIQLSERRVELKSLLQLATSFDHADLKKVLEEIVPHLHKPRTIDGPLLKLKRQQQQPNSDLTLVSSEGKSLHCHRCVLVARSEYFRSMLLMGWRESSNDMTSLTMPVKYNVLKAVIDFMYTDEFPVTVKGAETVEWVMSVLVMADQLLLTRLKEVCECYLSEILELRNAVDFLEFSEAYSACHLKKCCLQFICVNASCFLEARWLDNLDSSLLEDLSRSYQELFLSKKKRAIKFPDLPFEHLPQSYFQDDKLVDEGIESGGSAEEDESDMVPGVTTADKMVDALSGGQTTVISPRAASNSRRKRKRKNSQSEKRHSTPTKYTPPASPVEDKVPDLRLNPSPPNPASPDSIISPCSPISAPASHCTTPREAADAKQRSRTATPSSGSQWINIEKKKKNANSNVSGSKNGVAGSSEEEVGSIVSVGSVSVSASHRGGEGKPHPCPTTPLSAPERIQSHPNKTVKGKKRTRLMNKFNTMVNEESLAEPDSHNRNNSTLTRRSYSPSALEATAKGQGPWVSVNTGTLTNASNLRDIMAKEEETQQKNRQAKQSFSPPPPLPPAPSTALQGPRLRSPPPSSLGPCVSLKDDTARHLNSTSAQSARSQPIPVQRNSQRETSFSSSPASGNPWGTPEASSPSVIISMRDLIAEAEEEDKKNRRNASMNKPKPTTKEEKAGKRKPALPLHQQVSFASIIKSQESESRLAPRKSLSLILIEERAISDLEKAYSSADNPDEYIKVQRCSKNAHQQEQGRRTLPLNSPWTN